MIRKLWMMDPKLEWDDPIPENRRGEWETFFEEAKKLKDLEFPRCIKPQNVVGDPTLVLFSDASKEAYGTVIDVLIVIQFDDLHKYQLCPI